MKQNIIFQVGLWHHKPSTKIIIRAIRKAH